MSVLVPPNAGPHDYSFSPNDIQKIAKADVLIMNGAGLENWLQRGDKGAQAGKTFWLSIPARASNLITGLDVRPLPGVHSEPDPDAAALIRTSGCHRSMRSSRWKTSVMHWFSGIRPTQRPIARTQTPTSSRLNDLDARFALRALHSRTKISLLFTIRSPILREIMVLTLSPRLKSFQARNLRRERSSNCEK